MTQSDAQIFHAAPFAPDGDLLGIGIWQISALSSRWLDFARQVLQTAGNAFHGPLPPPFEHVGLRFTSAEGAALATFSLNGVTLASSVYLRGDDLTVERQVLEMFVESVRRVEIVRQLQTDSQPFSAAFDVLQRPLHIVIAWGSADDEDGEMIAQLGTHFAAAFLTAHD